MSRKIDLGDALKGIGDSYIQEHPADLATVRAHVETYRKRRSWGIVLSGIVAGASLFLVAVVVGSLDLGSQETITRPATLSVGFSLDLRDAPHQIEAREGSAFIGLADDSIVRVDLGAEEPVWTSPLGGRVGDVVWGRTGLWVTLPDQDRLLRLDLQDGSIAQEIQLGSGESPTRVTVGVRAARVVTTRGVLRIPLPYQGQTPRLLFDGNITDIAMGHSGFWLLNDRGAIFAIDPDSGAPVAGLRTETRAPGGEITFARGVIWYGRPDADVLVMIDETTGLRRTRLSLPGDYVDLDAGADGPWVLSRTPGGEGLVSVIDAPLAELGATRRSVSGGPVDLSTGRGGIWVIQADDNSVLHLVP